GRGGGAGGGRGGAGGGRRRGGPRGRVGGRRRVPRDGDVAGGGGPGGTRLAGNAGGKPPMSEEKSVWISGVGVASPLGHSFDAVADSLLAGRSGVRAVRRYDVRQHPCQVAAQIDRVPCPPGWDEAEFRRKPTPEQLLLWCCAGALRGAGWWERRGDVRCGVVLGMGAEWLRLWEEDWLAGGTWLYEPHRAAPSLVARVQSELDLHGPGVTLSAACASGNHALAQARRWLQLGWVDVCLAGACDMSVSPMSLAAFGNLRALTRRNDAPA